METALSKPQFSVEITGEVVARKELALQASALIGRVSTADENEKAVLAQAALREVLSSVEKARKELKKPVLEAGRAIDAKADEFTKEVKEEELRVATLVGGFQELELSKQRALEASRRKELDDLDRQRQAELAEAQSPEEQDEINAKYDRMAADMAPEPIAKAKGQVVTEDWEITVSDVHALAKFHPNCVNIEPRLSDIKALLNAGMQVRGVTAKKVVKATVRAKPERKALTV